MLGFINCMSTCLCLLIKICGYPIQMFVLRERDGRNLRTNYACNILIQYIVALEYDVIDNIKIIRFNSGQIPNF